MSPGQTVRALLGSAARAPRATPRDVRDSDKTTTRDRDRPRPLSRLILVRTFGRAGHMAYRHTAPPPPHAAGNAPRTLAQVTAWHGRTRTRPRQQVPPRGQPDFLDRAADGFPCHPAKAILESKPKEHGSAGIGAPRGRAEAAGVRRTPEPRRFPPWEAEGSEGVPLQDASPIPAPLGHAGRQGRPLARGLTWCDRTSGQRASAPRADPLQLCE